MDFTRILALGLSTTIVVACAGDGKQSDDSGSTTDPSSTTSDVTATTIPLPTTDPTTGDVGSATADESTTSGVDETTTSVDETTAGSTGSSEESSGSSGEPAGSSSSDGGTSGYDVQWCILQWPPMVELAVGEAFTIYTRLYAPGLTDLTGVTDPAPELVVEVGYSVDGSNPETGMGAPWTWLPATPNAGYGPGAPDYSAVNDEYQGELSIGMAGIYDHAVRISGDSGATWVYCDLDGLTVGGYTTDQAGHAAVGQ
ncbi:hypothetical protein [Paraliomyxa miuraensis]|uniref:hypothetical protein n=1 Tax=Paraliomyxa miuraensis TaxID=376150 RepID=UPI0022595F03|nr:hypothetical protein [Paraliomyxa miuraensis]MCX4247278.1 hypothetical protein [Paraliomyxa miuraensis]